MQECGALWVLTCSRSPPPSHYLDSLLKSTGLNVRDPRSHATPTFKRIICLSSLVSPTAWNLNILEPQGQMHWRNKAHRQIHHETPHDQDYRHSLILSSTAISHFSGRMYKSCHNNRLLRKPLARAAARNKSLKSFQCCGGGGGLIRRESGVALHHFSEKEAVSGTISTRTPLATFRNLFWTSHKISIDISLIYILRRGWLSPLQRAATRDEWQQYLSCPECGQGKHFVRPEELPREGSPTTLSRVGRQMLLDHYTT